MNPDQNREIVFLGTGTSIGVPVIGCDCPVCQSDDPKNNRTRSSILVRSPRGNLVVDTGPDFRQQCLRENITELDAAIFTHCHTDHIIGFDDLRRFTLGKDATIDIYANQQTTSRLQAAFDYLFTGTNRYYGYLKPTTHLIDVDQSFSLLGWEITPLPVHHGKVDTIGFLFAEDGDPLFAYIPDAKTLSDQAAELIKQVPVLILDALQMQPHYTHLSIDEAVDVAQQAEARQTWFTHVSCRVDYQIEGSKLPSNIQFAWDGLTLDLDGAKPYS